MARRRRRSSFGSSPGEHASEARLYHAQMMDKARAVQTAIRAGKCDVAASRVFEMNDSYGMWCAHKFSAGERFRGICKLPAPVSEARLSFRVRCVRP